MFVPRAVRSVHPSSGMGGRAWARRAAAFAALAFLLVLMQTLGFMHTIAHAPGLASILSPAASQAPRVSVIGQQPAQAAHIAHAETASQGLGPWVQALFDSHVKNGVDCKVYDQLAHADLAFAAAMPLPADIVSAPPAALQDLPLMAAQATGYLARGPPAAIA